MKIRLIALLYLMALAFGTNALADDEEYKESKKADDEQVEGEVEEAKVSINLNEGNVDQLFLGTIAKVVGTLLSKAGVPADHADAVGKHVAEQAHEEVKAEKAQEEMKAEKAAGNYLNFREGNVDGLFLSTITKIVGGLLSKGGLPAEHADKIAKAAAEEVAKEAPPAEAPAPMAAPTKAAP